MINWRKAGRAAAVIMMLALLVCGCGEKNTGETAKEDVQQEEGKQAADEKVSEEETTEAEQPAAKEPSEDEKAPLSVEEVYQKIEQEVSLQSPACMDKDFISNYYGMDTDALEEYVFSISEDAAQAETVIIMKVKDEGDTESIADSLQEVVEEKKEEMRDYIPEQFAIVEKSEVVTKDNYVWLVISENEDKITSVIENELF